MRTRKIFVSVVLLLGLTATSWGQVQQAGNSSTDTDRQGDNVRQVNYQQAPMHVSEVLGNPFGDEAVGSAVPAPTSSPVQEAIISPTQIGGTSAYSPVPVPCIPSCADPGCADPGCADPGCADPGCAAGPGCGAAAPSCAATGCDAGCSAKGCSSCGGGLGLHGLGLGLCNCELGDAFTLSGALHGDCPPCVNIGGWVSAGYHTANNGMFNNSPDRVNLHQGWLYAERVADCDNPIGFRVDAMYGIDAGDTQAFGNPDGSWDFNNGFDRGAGYGFALPQAYLEMALTNDLSVKVGHFYTLIGYEVVPAPDNFFYSHAMTMFNSEPFTHTGVLFTKTAGDFTLYGGWTLGWDSGFDQLDNGSSWLGGFSTSLSEDISFSYMSTAGNFGWRGDQAYSHSLVFDTTLTDSLNYVLQSDLLRVNGTGEDNIGINQYFLYSVNECLGLGARLEWWKSDVLTGYVPHGGTAPATGSFSSYAATFGANIRPHANLTLRPEVRFDWSPAANYDEAYFGMDAVFTF